MKEIIQKIYVINLTRRKDRWEKFVKHAEIVGLTGHERWHGVDGLSHQPFLDLPDKFRGWEGSLSCTLTHVNIARMMLASEMQHILVLEDDCRFTVPWACVSAWLEAVMAEDHTQIHLGSAPGNHGPVLRRVEGLYDVGRALNTHAYVMSRKLAKMLVDAYDANPLRSDISLFIDRLILEILPEQTCAPVDFVVQDKSVASDVKWGCPDDEEKRRREQTTP